MKKKFEVIEEGRLSKSDMSSIMGGTNEATLICKETKDLKYVSGDCGDGKQFSSCPLGYLSCTDWNMACGNYAGPTGPAGNEGTDPGFNDGGNSGNTPGPLTPP